MMSNFSRLIVVIILAALVVIVVIGAVVFIALKRFSEEEHIADYYCSDTFTHELNQKWDECMNKFKPTLIEKDEKCFEGLYKIKMPHDVKTLKAIICATEQTRDLVIKWEHCYQRHENTTILEEIEDCVHPEDKD